MDISTITPPPILHTPQNNTNFDVTGWLEGLRQECILIRNLTRDSCNLPLGAVEPSGSGIKYAQCCMSHLNTRGAAWEGQLAHNLNKDGRSKVWTTCGIYTYVEEVVPTDTRPL
jgi:hypothetical protein